MPPTHDALLSSDSSPRSPLYASTYCADLLGDLAQRVVGEVEPEQLLLPAQPLAGRRLGHVAGSGRSRTAPSRRACRTATPGRSAGRAARPGPRPARRRGRQQLGRMAELVQRADPDQRFEDAPVDEPQVDARRRSRPAIGTARPRPARRRSTRSRPGRRS